VLRQTCKALQPVVDGLHLPQAMRLPVAIRMSRTWWHSHCGRPSPTKWAHVLNNLFALVASANVTSLDLLCGSQYYGAQVASLICVLRQCPRLERLSLSSNGLLGCSDTPLVAAALQPCTAITVLQLPRNKIGAAGMHALVPALATLVRLTVLDLSWNDLRDKGAEALGEVLELLTALASLNLFANQIQASGAAVFALGLRRCAALTELDVGSNELMNIGASALCIALAHCPRLAHLELSNNRCLPVLVLPCWSCRAGPVCCRNTMSQH
jgi:Leucine-rich repeat (LRR) protein